jgi:hypothetical protein
VQWATAAVRRPEVDFLEAGIAAVSTLA